MWLTLLVMAIAVSLEPFRIGMTLLMLNRPRPIVQLLGFLAGGFTMGIAVGVTVLFALRATLLGSTHFTLPKVQIVSGAIVIVLAAIVGSGIRLGRSERPGRLSTQARRLAGHGSPWIAVVAGLGIALPSLDYLAALAVIHASDASTATQLLALVSFNVVAFSLVEVPLVAYLIAPDRTKAALVGLHGWLRSRKRRDVAVLLGVVGAALVLVGWVGL